MKSKTTVLRPLRFKTDLASNRTKCRGHHIARWEGVAAEVGKGRGDGEDVEGAEEEEEEGLEAEM